MDARPSPTTTSLAVVDSRESRVFLGIVAETDLLRIYNQSVLGVHQAERVERIQD